MSQTLLTVALIELVGGPAFERALSEAQDLTSGRSGIEIVAIRKPRCFGAADTVSPSAGTRLEAATVPLRRSLALKLCKARYIAFIEDTIQLSPDWFNIVIDQFSSPEIAAVWGPIKIAEHLAPRARALGRLEYGRHDRGQHKDAIGELSADDADIPGACMVFRVAALRQAMQGTQPGIVEHEVAGRLIDADLRILRIPALEVEYCETDSYGSKLSTRLGHGRLYASSKLAGAAFSMRVLTVVKSILLPLVLTARTLRLRSSLISWFGAPREVYWILLMSLAWATGEFLGAVLGSGDSADTWR